MITTNIERELFRCIQDEAIALGCTVMALNGVEDHVHVLLKMPSTRSPSEVMKHIKGVSSHFVKNQLADCESFKWQEGYGVFSVTPAHIDKVIAYIQNQKQHHANGELHSRWEETFMEL